MTLILLVTMTFTFSPLNSKSLDISASILRSQPQGIRSVSSSTPGCQLCDNALNGNMFGHKLLLLPIEVPRAEKHLRRKLNKNVQKIQLNVFVLLPAAIGYCHRCIYKKQQKNTHTQTLSTLTFVTRGSVSSRMETKGISRKDERNSTWISSSLDRGKARMADTPRTTRSWQALRDSDSGSPPAGERATISRLRL